MASVGLGAFLEGLRVFMKDTDENKKQGIAGKRGSVVGTGETIPGGEIYIMVQLDGDEKFYQVLARNLVRE